MTLDLLTENEDVTLSRLKKLLSSKEISSVELTKYFLERAKSKDDLGCFLSLTEEEALKQANKADEKIAKGEDAPLLGVPLAIKDVLTTDFGTTTCASKILENYHSPFNATVINKMLDAGAVLYGKTNLDEFAMGSSNENSSFKPVKNPWDTERVPGGSSGGSAAAVAARIAPASLGTDTGGSIRQPAAFCGITGIKPTYGRVSRYGLVAYASSLDQIGPLGLSAEDCALITRVISGKDPLDSTSMEMEVPAFDTEISKDIKGMKVGVPKEYFIDGMQSEVSEALAEAKKVLSDLGAEIVEISLPHTDAAVAAYYIIAPAECSSNLARFDGIKYGYRAEETHDLFDLYAETRSEGFGEEVKRRILIGTYVLSSGYYDAYYLKAQKVRRLIQNDFLQAFEDKCDVILAPTAPTTPFKIGENINDPLAMYLNDIFTIPLNLAGMPGMSLPCGFDGKNLPIGMQLIAGPWQEQRIFNVAHAYQDATDWHTRKPEGV